ncbi:MAG: nucleotide exchange factor GrpE [Fusobacteriaceae bacterium]
MTDKENKEEKELEKDLEKKDSEKIVNEEVIDAEIQVSEVEQLNIDNEKLSAEIENLKNDYLRKNAEFQNFRKRQEKELEELRKFASEKVMIKLLDNVDNLERAITASLETKDFDSLIKGVEMTLSQMKGIMQSEGVEVIESEDSIYDPHIHHAVMVEESEEHENDQIIQVFQKAYKMKDKIIRPAMVKVCKKS